MSVKTWLRSDTWAEVLNDEETNHTKFEFEGERNMERLPAYSFGTRKGQGLKAEVRKSSRRGSKKHREPCK